MILRLVGVIVFCVATFLVSAQKRCIDTIAINKWNTSSAELSPDGKYVLTCTNSAGNCLCDIQSTQGRWKMKLSQTSKNVLFTEHSQHFVYIDRDSLFIGKLGSNE